MKVLNEITRPTKTQEIREEEAQKSISGWMVCSRWVSESEKARSLINLCMKTKKEMITNVRERRRLGIKEFKFVWEEEKKNFQHGKPKKKKKEKIQNL